MPKKQKDRQVTFKNHVSINGKMIEICKSCFIKVFGETNKFIWNV